MNAEPAVVTRGEHDLLVVARALVEPGSFDAVEPLLRGEVRVKKMAPTGMRLLRDVLAKGAVRALARGGGWRSRARTGGGGRVATGRLWEIHPSLELRFSPFTYELVRWLAAAPLAAAKVPTLDGVSATTAGDEIVAYLACALVEGSEIAGVVAAQPAVRSSALAWLAFSRMLALSSPSSTPPAAAAFARIAAGPGAVVVEGLEDELAHRAIAGVHAGGALADPRAASGAGAAERAVLDAFLDAADAAGRRDLATFLVTAGSRLLGTGASPAALAAAWTAALDPNARLADRAEARRASAAPLRALRRVGRWDEEARLTRFFDDGYDAAQALLARWEHLGRDGFARADDVARALDSLDAGATGSQEEPR